MNMDMKKKIIYTPNICPYCQSTEIIPKKEFIKDNYLKIPYYCKKCGKVSKAIFFIEYQETEGWY
jgi:uncharacterized Zn finger protein